MPSSLPLILAPICASGPTTLFIGLAWRYLSPVRVDVNCCGLKRPIKSLVVVPELPQSIILSGSLRPWRPFPLTKTWVPLISIEAPRARIAFAVDRVSSDIKKSLTKVVPVASEPSMRDLWDIDLSPGGAISPLSGLELPIIILLDISSNLIIYF